MTTLRMYIISESTLKEFRCRLPELYDLASDPSIVKSDGLRKKSFGLQDAGTYPAK